MENETRQGGDAAVLRPDLSAIREAAARLSGIAVRTPLIRLDELDLPAEIYLKLECLQPIGSFKLRPAGAVLSEMAREVSRDGVFTASSGNMALGVAYVGRQLGLPVTAVVPPEAPAIKLERLGELGARIEHVSHEAWWRVIRTGRHPGLDIRYVDGVKNTSALAGDGTIGLEILEELPDVNAIVAPFGGGGLINGVASAVKAIKPDTRIVAGESEAASPLRAAFDAGSPVEIPVSDSFITGMGVSSVLAAMWPIAASLIDDVVTVSLAEVADAVRRLATRARVVAEGAGAVSLASAMRGTAGTGKVVCVISGGVIDPADLATCLRGETPRG